MTGLGFVECDSDRLLLYKHTRFRNIYIDTLGVAVVALDLFLKIHALGHTIYAEDVR